ncbi:GNAT family N-acetyltransferase [Thalassomonas actiniarum]|uniref:GNAT family N-acetyltransferase n=1 Tax=Thalassomonas actiniarum TaxID=485447 RepID=A0AAE9YVL4_9GAMM|nr:GNAT family N-acetyltransferase [Thalassomonas actiniarum]WDE01160.1 GNAT family N-acetyltransferase [Thalassomonas actiniarum]
MHNFTTERLFIRALEKQDQALYCHLYTDTKVMRHICQPLSQEQAIKAFKTTLNKQTSKTKNQFSWAITSKETNQAIGIVGFQSQEKEHAILGLLISENSQGRGYAPEVFKKLISICNSTYGFKKFTSQVQKDNINSIKFLKLIGFKSEPLAHTKDIDTYVFNV